MFGTRLGPGASPLSASFFFFNIHSVFGLKPDASHILAQTCPNSSTLWSLGNGQHCCIISKETVTERKAEGFKLLIRSNFFGPIFGKKNKRTNKQLKEKNGETDYRVFGFLHISLVTCNGNKNGDKTGINRGKVTHARARGGNKHGGSHVRFLEHKLTQ